MTVWTVTLKQTINSDFPAGLTVTVYTQQNCHNYPDLQEALADMGYPVSSLGGVWSDSWWEWS